MAEPSTVFLSYARADEKRARPIIEVLERAGFSVWWDGLLGGGERFARATADALERAQAVVVLWSKTSIESHWVNDEAAHARDNGRLVPLSIDGSLPPLGFRQFQVIDVSRARRDGPELRQLVEAVAALHDAAPTNRTPRPAAAEPGGFVERRRLLIGAGAAMVWDAETGRLLATWPGNITYAHVPVFTNEGRMTFATGAGVATWDPRILYGKALRAEACRRRPRELSDAERNEFGLGKSATGCEDSDWLRAIGLRR